MPALRDIHGGLIFVNTEKKEARASFLLEKTEMYTPVRACLYMPRVTREIRVLAMLHDHPSVFFEYLLLENEVG